MPKRPAGELSLGRQAEWEAYVRKLVSKVCSAAEVPTVKRALLTLRELQHFQAARGRNGLEAVDRVPPRLQKNLSTANPSDSSCLKAHL